jgi:hypothetical protein
VVLLVHLVTGVGEAEGEVAVVGEEEQAGGVGVEPADGVESQPLFGKLCSGKQGHHGGPALGVFDRGYHAEGLMQRDVDELLGAARAGL